MTDADGPTGRVAVLEGGAVLHPEAASSARARRIVRSLLQEVGRTDWLDAAELAVSEVVTNAALHAHTEIHLRVRVFDDEVCVDVRDLNTALPIPRGYDEEATTGRGLDLVAAISRSCGVITQDDGKVVWFCVGDADLRREHDRAAYTWLPPEPPAVTPAPDDPCVDVVLEAMPPTLWLSARQHHDAIIRELVLYAASTAVEGIDITAADAARAAISGRLVEEIRRASEAGAAVPAVPPGHPSPLPPVPAQLDLVLRVDPATADRFCALQDTLDVAESLAVSGVLLTRPGLPEVVAVRDWACEQVIAQLAGGSPSPWPGTAQERFETELRERQGDAHGWDPSTVTTSTRSVIAGDDANRIVAISDTFADLCGWPREELVGRRVVTVIPPRLREAHVAGFTRHLTTGEAHVLGVPIELPLWHRDGYEVACHFLVERAPGQDRIYLAWIDAIQGG